MCSQPSGHKSRRVWKETASGAKQERAERKKVLVLAQARKVDVILVTELIRWGRSARFVARSLTCFKFRFVSSPPKGQIEPIPDPFIEAIVSGKQGPLPAGVQLILRALRRCDHWSFD